MLRKTLLSALLLTLALSPLLVSAADDPSKADWPQFRGPKRDGVSTDKGLLKEWPKAGPPLLWEAKGAGRGYSSVSIASGKIYTMGDGPSSADDKDEYVLCFDETNGKEL